MLFASRPRSSAWMLHVCELCWFCVSIAISAVLQTPGCAARGEVGAGGVAGPHAGPQPEHGADSDPADGMHVANFQTVVADMLRSCANPRCLTGCAAIQLRRVFLTQLGELVRRRQALAHLLQVTLSNPSDVTCAPTALLNASIACHAHHDGFACNRRA